MAVKPIPDGFHSVTSYLLVEDAAGQIDFLKRAFGAEEIECHKTPDGSIMHAQVKIGDSIVMMGEPRGEFKAMPCMIYLYVNDADATFKRALEAGATSVMEPMDQFYGDRSGGVKDKAGNMWFISTHIEDISPEELAKRAEGHAKQ